MDELTPICCAPLAVPTLSDERAADLERVFNALADRHRVKILDVLVQAGEQDVCMCELIPALGVGRSVSYHLKHLVDADLLERIGAIFARPPAAAAA